MIAVTADGVMGRRMVRVCGMVDGSTVRARNLGRGIVAVIKSLFGGEIIEYSELLTEARTEATARMIEQVERIGANGAVNVRLATSVIMSGATELFAYGTAVVLEDE